VQSITCYSCKELGYGYLVVKVKNHDNNGFTSLRLERIRNKDPDSTNSSTSLSPPSSLVAPDSPERANTPHILTPINASVNSVQHGGSFAPMDIIRVFGNLGNVEDVKSHEILFVNKDVTFTLHALSMIAKVVQDVRAKYPVEGAKYYWFAAVVAGVAKCLYQLNSDSGESRDNSLDDFWGSNVNDSVNDAIKLFGQLKDTNERLIKEAANPAETAKREAKTGEEARAKAKQPELEAEQAEQDARRAREQAEQATHEADQAKREVQERDAEITRLKSLLAQNIGKGTVEHGG